MHTLPIASVLMMQEGFEHTLEGKPIAVVIHTLSRSMHNPPTAAVSDMQEG